jgi:hypothetical protein
MGCCIRYQAAFAPPGGVRLAAACRFARFRDVIYANLSRFYGSDWHVLFPAPWEARLYLLNISPVGAEF